MSTPVFNLLDRYLLATALRPLASALAVSLLILLMERLLRLVRLVAGGGSFDQVMWMALNLVPHYLGLAMPAALFFAVHVVMARLDADSELDAMRGAGVALARACRAFFVLAFVLAGFALAVVGWLQPLGRYEYRAMVHALSQQVWDGELPARTLVEAADGLLISAEKVEAGGRELAGVFVRQSLDDGSQTVTTARAGRMLLSDDGTHMRIQLEDGEKLHLTRAGNTRVLAFAGLTDMVTVRVAPEPFRPRGAEVRELTLPELAGHQASGIPRQQLAAEFHARLVRAASLPFVPMLAVGFAITAKRTPRGMGLVAGGLVLFLYHHALLTGESLAESGHADPVPALWGAFALFALLNVLLYLALDRHPVPGLAWRRR